MGLGVRSLGLGLVFGVLGFGFFFCFVFGLEFGVEGRVLGFGFWVESLRFWVLVFGV